MSTRIALVFCFGLPLSALGAMGTGCAIEPEPPDRPTASPIDDDERDAIYFPCTADPSRRCVMSRGQEVEI